MSSNLFIITAPSGAGKTTLIKKVLEYAQEHDKNVALSVSILLGHLETVKKTA